MSIIMRAKKSLIFAVCILFVGLMFMSEINSSFSQNCQNKVDFFFRRLRCKDRFDTIKQKCELLIKFFYVVVKEFIGFIDIGYACEPKLW